MAAAALADLKADTTLRLIGSVVICVLVLSAADALEINPFSPISVFQFPFRKVETGQLVWVGILIGIAYAVARLSVATPALATALQTNPHFDTNLTIAAMVCAAAVAAGVAVLVRIRILERNLAFHETGVDVETTRHMAASLRASYSYWRATVELLALAFIALIPAALKANWAWNVLASVLLPMYLLAVKHHESPRVSWRLVQLEPAIAGAGVST